MKNTFLPILLMAVSGSALAGAPEVIHVDHAKLVIDNPGKVNIQTELNLPDILEPKAKTATLILDKKINGRRVTVATAKVRLIFLGDAGLAISVAYDRDQVMTFQGLKRFRSLEVRDLLGTYEGMGLHAAVGLGARAINFNHGDGIMLNTVSLQAGLGYGFSAYRISLEAENENEPVWQSRIELE